jgi:ubiquitin carboxyl-terminal hydrolase 10
VTCSRTNQEIEAWQQVTLEELPLVLLLHLKWFDYKLDGASKIVKCVEFPIDLKVDPSKYSNLWDGARSLLLCCGSKQGDT